jgi:hypothetical protein
MSARECVAKGAAADDVARAVRHVVAAVTLAASPHARSERLYLAVAGRVVAEAQRTRRSVADDRASCLNEPLEPAQYLQVNAGFVHR